MQFTLTVNDVERTVEAQPDLPLVWVLRDLLGPDAVRIGCGRGLNCGGCTVRIDGEPHRTCDLTIAEAQGRRVHTPGWRSAGRSGGGPL